MIPESILSFFHASKSWPFRSMTYFNFLLEATLAGSILILVMLVLRRVFRRKIGSRLVYLAWLLVAIRLLLPIAIPNPLMDEFRPTYSTDAGARPVADQFRVRSQDAMASMSRVLSDLAEETESQFTQGVSDVLHEVDAYTSYGWLGKGFLMCYVAGGLIVLAVFTARHLRFRRKLKRNTIGPLEGEQLALYRALCVRLRVKELPVLLVDPLTTPCLVGAIRPVIALPLTLPPDALSEALTHELCHYKAKDSWWVLLQCVCCTVHWFNPLVWVAQRFVRTDCELACDERVAAKLTEHERLHYANTLVTTARRAYAPRAGVLSTGMTMTGKRLKRRVDALIHMKAVRKAAAAIVAAVLVVLTVAAFSTAESTAQTTRLTSDQSGFPFTTDDVFPTPDAAFGGPVALTPLRTPAEAEAQAKRYLRSLYPDVQSEMEQYLYRVQAFGNSSWEISIWPPEGGEMPYYHMELKTGGGLLSVNRTDAFSNGDETQNVPSVLPGNLKEVLLDYGRQVCDTMFQGIALGRISLYEDVETAQARYLSCSLYSADDIDSIDMTVQIAPSFRLIGLDGRNIAVRDASENRPIDLGKETLTYTKDPSLTFDATFWGQTDSQYTISPEAALSAPQAFDMAVDIMLARSGLTKEELLRLPLKYGYYDKSNFDGDQSEWRFVWIFDPEMDAGMYWVSFSDTLAPANIMYSAPGEGVG